MARQGRDASTFDALLELKDAGLLAADGAATVGGQARIVFLGNGRVDGRVIVDLSTMEVASGDEVYRLRLQFSNSSSFASGIVNGPEMVIGDTTGTGSSADSGVGRYEFGFTNDVRGTIYSYVRLYADVSGTIATGADFKAFITTA